ncbi:MAG: hypothetical protein KGI79_02555 [Patescibacteria group bacterium]|nr:hypothetical protein [Patescibacteria group bacterium]MDE2116731.1 hypothetical protein [Patescibacteria group bacterium]
MSKRLVLLDSHAILHRAYHALPDFSTSKGEPTGALYGLCTMLLSAIEKLKPDYIVAAYDLPKPTHRHEAYKDYKAGRAKADEELVAQIVRSRDVYAALDIPVYDKEGFEADDILGTIVELVKGDKDIEVIIASGDMDTLQLVSGECVRVYTLKKGIKDTIIYDEEGVHERFGFGPELLPDYKGLRGDPSDNIIGIRGIGEKTATILIQKFGSIEDIYKALKKNKEKFAKDCAVAGIKPRIVELVAAGQEDAEFSKVLATIRRDAPIDWKLPVKPWREAVNVEKASALFTELEFRTMAIRLKNVLGQEVRADDAGQSDDADQPAEATPVDDTFSDEAFRETAVMLWVVDSNCTDPTLDDVMDFTKAKTLALARDVLEKEIKKRGLERVWQEIEKPLIPIVAEMKKRGVKIDKDQLVALAREYRTELASLEKSIWRLADTEFNISSPKQLGEVLFAKLGLKGGKKTAGGALSTKESELEKLREEHPIIDEILKYRELSKLVGTYLETIPTLLDDRSRLHSTFIQAGSATGRMASKDPNIQNIPNKTELGRRIRDAFVADDGWKLLSFDYSQIELRIAAFLSGDKKFIDIFRRGEDVHAAVAGQVFGVPTESVTKAMRTQAKVINFGVMYGMGVNALRANLGTDRATAQKFYNEYFEKFSGLRDYLDHIKAETARRGYTETYFGRRRYFEGMKSKVPYIRASAERMAINAPIQGTEADIVKLAMVRIDEYIRAAGLAADAHILMQVHDEIVLEARASVVSKIAPRIKEIMESIIPPKDVHGIVCVALAREGDDWGEMKEIKIA